LGSIAGFSGVAAVSSFAKSFGALGALGAFGALGRGSTGALALFVAACGSRRGPQAASATMSAKPIGPNFMDLFLHRNRARGGSFVSPT
jgi:hypothetical protein